MQLKTLSSPPITALVSGICFYKRIKIDFKTRIKVKSPSNPIQYDNDYYHVVEFTTPKYSTDIQFGIEGENICDTIFMRSLSGKLIKVNSTDANIRPTKRLEKEKTYLLVFKFSEVVYEVEDIKTKHTEDKNNQIKDSKAFTLPIEPRAWIGSQQNIVSFQL